MGKKADEIIALREQVEALRAEVAALKAVPWHQQSGGGVAYGWPNASVPQCTCSTSARCQKHYPHDWGTVWVSAQNMCAGAAPVPQVITIDPSAGPLTFTRDFTSVAAGCAPQAQTFMVPIGP